MRRRSWPAAGIAAAAVAAAIVVPAQAAPPAPVDAGVTLLTGDHVTAEGKVRPGKGREHLTFRRYRDERGDLHVVPEDVQPLLNADKIDPRLFDVSLLERSGYDDTGSKVTPLIVQGGVTLASIGASTVEVPKGTNFLAARAAGEGKVWLDGRVTASLDRSVPQIGAPEAWAGGHTGKDARVAVLDTGIDATHPDLVDSVIEAKNFSDSQFGTDDRVGHGTHVASTITGDGRYKGVAPDAKLVIGKVLGDHGGGRESDIIAGMEWAAGRADVVNMSLGDPWPSEGDDPMSTALNRLTQQHGTLFVVAAGNSGPHDESIGSPAAADEALTVGAVDRDDALAEFSSRGPRWVNGAIKPDITAPGVGIVAARAKNSSAPGDTHFAASGTSMATPHVAGAAAILAAQHPDWTPRQLKAALMGSAKANDSLTVFEQGAGRVDVARVTKQQVSAAKGSLSLGTALWPHHDDPLIEHTITYRNTGAAPVTLDLTTAVKDGSGKPAAAGMVSVEPSSLTVPAGGEASAKLTVRTSIEAPDGRYGGVLLASGGGTSVRTPVGFVKEVESYDVKLSFVDADGKPTDKYFYRFVSHDVQQAYVRFDPSGTITQRVPKGKYYYEAHVSSPTAPSTQIVEPAFDVTGDTTFVNDARTGVQPDLAVEKPKAKIGSAEVEFDMRTRWGDTGLTMILPHFEPVRIRPAATSTSGFTYRQTALLAEPDAAGGFAGSPYLYHVGFTQPGTVPSDLRRKIADRSLAVVHSEIASDTAGTATAMRDYLVQGPVPLQLTEYFSPGLSWSSSMLLADGDQMFPPRTNQRMVPRTYRKGTTKERWNQAVFGPAFPYFALRQDLWAARGGDQVRLEVPLFTDQSPHHAGGSKVVSAKTVLYRGDTPVLEGPTAGYLNGKLPAESSKYRLHTEANREGISQLSTRVSADWTFTSGHVPGEERKAVPLLAVRFAPNLDLENRTAAGRAFTFPVSVQRNGSDRVTDATTKVQVSYDDGATWKPVRLARIGDRWLATVHHPRDARFVSLKAQASDRAGNTVDQTIIRAYSLK